MYVASGRSIRLYRRASVLELNILLSDLAKRDIRIPLYQAGNEISSKPRHFVKKRVLEL